MLMCYIIYKINSLLFSPKLSALYEKNMLYPNLSPAPSGRKRSRSCRSHQQGRIFQKHTSCRTGTGGGLLSDLKVQVVSSFPDLKVKTVDSFPDDIGEWQFVDYGEDFTIQFVDSFLTSVSNLWTPSPACAERIKNIFSPPSFRDMIEKETALSKALIKVLIDFISETAGNKGNFLPPEAIKIVLSQLFAWIRT